MFFTTCVSKSPKRDVAFVEQSQMQQQNQALLNYPSFIELLKVNRAQTVAQALQILAPKYNEYLKFRTAMYVSQSIQEATFAEPRVIVFGPEAKFVFTFNGGPSHYGGDAIEAYQFDDRTKKFNFYSIIFKKEMTDNIFEDEEIAFETAELIVSKANPKLCLGCHGESHPSPIWSNDLNWAGAFGSNDDLLFGSFNKKNYLNHGLYEYLTNLRYPRSLGRWIDLPKGAADVEVNGYLKYLAGAIKHPRYQHLPPQVFEAGYRKYARGVTIEQIDESEAIEAESSRLRVKEADRPNLFFTEKVVGLAMQSLIAEIERNPQIKELLKKLSIDPDTNQYFGAGREGLFTSEGQLLDKLDEPTKAMLAKKLGSFKKHFREVLKQEFEMQDVRLARIEHDFHSPVIVPVGWPGDGVPLPDTVLAYERLLGRKLSRRELINVQAEAGGLHVLAVISYVLKFGDIKMSDYEINSDHYPREGRKRVLSFFEGTKDLLKYLSSQ